MSVTDELPYHDERNDAGIYRHALHPPSPSPA